MGNLVNLARLLLLVWAVQTCVAATVDIDDANPTVQYSTGQIGWDHKNPSIPNNSADASQAFDSTYTVNHVVCLESDACSFQIPFTGTGISLNVIQGPSPLKARITIDGSSPATQSLPATTTFNYGVVFFETQSLTNSSHVLELLLLDTTASDGSTVGSLIRFDVAHVTGPTPSGQGSPSSQSSSISHGGQSNIPSQSASSKPSSNSIVGPVVGGVVGGLAAIVFAAFLILRRVRKIRSRRELEERITMRAPDPPFDPQMMYQTPPQNTAPIAAPYAYPNALTPAPPTPTSNISDGRQSPFTTSVTSVAPLMASANPQFASVSSKLSSSGSVSQPLAGSSPLKLNNPTESSTTDLTRAKGPDTSNHPAPQQPATGALTAEQAELVHGLHTHGVPPAEIASVMEAMRREREEGQGASNLQGGPTSVEDAPPQYDFKG